MNRTLENMRVFFYSFLLVFNFCALAQSQYIEFIVTVDKDTIYGQIEEGTRRANQTGCVFMSEAGTQNYAPGELEAYQLSDGRIFQTINISGRGEPDTLMFAQLLMEGKGISLYRYEEIFYMGKDGEEHELEFDKFQTEIGRLSHSKLQTTHKYRRIINYLMNDCQGLTKKIQKTHYSAKSFEHMITLYCLCFNEDPTDYPNE